MDKVSWSGSEMVLAKIMIAFNKKVSSSDDESTGDGPVDRHDTDS